ncbi:related to manganese resistance protein [Rhynchosporium agropyri]|uniref:Related to manganese resistance protein n=1 Tax=Rhynchosporium agropyri TaxID=914238 RepID=A0A1E1LRY5_9HELO|nr:related to manganese resistance protein [Rhynchosporium agropyri]
MKKNSRNSNSNSSTDRIRSWARSKAHGSSSLTAPSQQTLPISNPSASLQATRTPSSLRNDSTNIPPFPSTDVNGLARQSSKPTVNDAANDTTSDIPPPVPPPEVDGERDIVNNEKPDKKNVAARFWRTAKTILLSSYINILLVFVPIGIAAKAAKLNPGVVFGMNAVAIVPLAGLLSHATESVAKRMGDTIGALMNVTFGNAVELIILYALLHLDERLNHANFLSIIALVKNEIRIVQASLLGSILANLLLILGMCFLVGGLRFREQIYNSTVTQMSACLLSLSVMSLLLPTAFHASFAATATAKANSAVLKVSRGTSVILLFVYVLYLLFQLKSHAYMYESTPQHIIDEELAPGPVAQWMETSTDDSSSSSSSDSEHSSGSNTTAKRFKRVMRGGKRRRKSSFGSKETSDKIEPSRTPSFGAGSVSHANTDNVIDKHRFGAIDFGDEGDDEDQNRGSQKNSVIPRSKKGSKKERKRQEKKARKSARRKGDDTVTEDIEPNEKAADADAPRRVDFAVAPEEERQVEQTALSRTQKRPFNLRNISSIRPQIPKTFSQNVFTQPSSQAPAPSGPIPRVRYGIRRTNSLPDRLSQSITGGAATPSTRVTPSRVSSLAISAKNDKADEDENISRTTAVVLLLVSTGLVALCAEFMVDAINDVVASNSGVSEAFIGLIILPIVGNAAEHVTSVHCASKNKMDLAIGVAVGSSIQIALFVTPFVVLLGWAMDKSMSLYFTLFETVSLFVSAFIVNFLVLDGRSNYLEGALLCAAYVIIAVAAFFYPNADQESSLGGADVVGRSLAGLVGF